MGPSVIGVSLNGGKSFRLTILVGHLPTVRAVTEKSAGLDMFSESVDCWQAAHFYELCDSPGSRKRHRFLLCDAVMSEENPVAVPPAYPPLLRPIRLGHTAVVPRREHDRIAADVWVVSRG